MTAKIFGRDMVAAYFISLSVWVGGMLVLALLVAPLTFKGLETKEAAGALFGSFLRTFAWFDLVCGLVCAGATTWIAFLKGISGGWKKAQIALLVGMLLVAAAHDLYVVPAAHRLRREIRNTDTEARFARLHKTSEVLFGLNILAGLCLVGISTRAFRF